MKKISLIIIILIVISVLLTSGYWYYRHLHPKYIPQLRPEMTITIIPGWDLRDVADYFVKLGFASSTNDVYQLVGEPAHDYRLEKIKAPVLNDFQDYSSDVNNLYISRELERKSDYVSYEGWLAPDTYRVYKNSTLEEIVKKLIAWRLNNITPEMYEEMERTNKTFYDVLTMASILEKEVRDLADKKMVADIFWRRLAKNWALQADSTVHYVVGKEGNVFTTSKDRQADSLWNTYKYPGLPPSPICNPGLDSIKAALEPTKNNYWYFLTDKNGTVYYAKTLEEQNNNRYKYL